MYPRILEAGKGVLPKQIEKFERETGVTLPPAMKRQLLMVNGGVPQPCYVHCLQSKYFSDGLCYVDRLLPLPLTSPAPSQPVIRVESLTEEEGVIHFILFATSGDNAIWLESRDGSEGPVYCQMDGGATLARARRDGHLAKLHDSYESFRSSFEYHPESLPWLPLIHNRDYQALIAWAKTAKKDINRANEFGFTPLDEAARFGDMMAAQILLMHKAKPCDAAKIAKQFGHPSVADVIRRASK
jgi:hypothetical protein